MILVTVKFVEKNLKAYIIKGLLLRCVPIAEVTELAATLRYGKYM
jgi:hypothetical protein